MTGVQTCALPIYEVDRSPGLAMELYAWGPTNGASGVYTAVTIRVPKGRVVISGWGQMATPPDTATGGDCARIFPKFSFVSLYSVNTTVPVGVPLLAVTTAAK